MDETFAAPSRRTMAQLLLTRPQVAGLLALQDRLGELAAGRRCASAEVDCLVAD